MRNLDQNKKFDLYPYYDALSNSLVLNKSDLESYVWFRIPDNVQKRPMSLYQITDFNAEDGPIDIRFTTETVMREHYRPWIRVNSDILNLNVGFHVIRFHFVDISWDDSASLYFSYTIQDDHPKKPYVYMNRSEVN